MPYQLPKHPNLLSVNTGRSRGAALAVGDEGAEMWLWEGTRRWQRLGRGPAGWKVGRAELSKPLLPPSPFPFTGQLGSGASLIQANKEAKGEKLFAVSDLAIS